MANWQNAPYGLRPYRSMLGGDWTIKTNPYFIDSTIDVNGNWIGYGETIYTNDPVIWATSRAGTNANGQMGTIGVYDPNFSDGTPSTFALVGAAAIIGSFQGCRYTSINTAVNNVIRQPYFPANAQVVPGTRIVSYVADDPYTIFEIQVSTNVDAANNTFTALPCLPNTNNDGGAPFNLAGTFGRNFALMIGGGTNFNTVQNAYTEASGITYANNPATGNFRTGLSAFYLCADTSTATGYNSHDYDKTVQTLPLRPIGFSGEVDNLAAQGLTMETTPFLSVQVLLNNPAVGKGSLTTVYVA